MTSSRSLLLAGVVAAGMAGSAASAAAQRLESGPPRAEIGVTAAGIGGLIDLSEFEGDPQMGSWSAGPVLVFNPSRKIGLELSAEILRLDRAQVQFYELSVLVRRRLRDARSFAFWRFGAGGRHEFERVQPTSTMSRRRRRSRLWDSELSDVFPGLWPSVPGWTRSLATSGSAGVCPPESSLVWVQLIGRGDICTKHAARTFSRCWVQRSLPRLATPNARRLIS
jgi:hypothetical protein